MTALSEWLKSMGDVNAMVLGVIIGTMMCIDMGGPVQSRLYLLRGHDRLSGLHPNGSGNGSRHGTANRHGHCYLVSAQ